MLWAIEVFIRSNIQTRKVFRYIDHLFEEELDALGAIQTGWNGVAIDEHFLAIFRICAVYGTIEYRECKKMLLIQRRYYYGSSIGKINENCENLSM